MEDYFEGFSEEISKWENIKELADQEISEKRSEHKNEASVQLLPRRYIALFGSIPKMEQKIYSKCKQCRMVFNPRDVLSHKNCVGKETTSLPQNLKKKVKSKKLNSSSGYSSNSTNNSNNNSNNSGSSNSSLVLKKNLLSKKCKNTRSVVSSATSTSSSAFVPEPTPNTSVVIAEAETSSENVGSTTSPDHNFQVLNKVGTGSGSLSVEEYYKNMDTKKRKSKKSSKSHQTSHKSKVSSSSSSSSTKPSSVAVSSTSSSVGSHTRSSSSYNNSTNISTTSKEQTKAVIAAADSTETLLKQTNTTTPPSPSASSSSSPSSSSSSSNKCSSKSRRGYKTLQSKKVTPSRSSKETTSSSDRKTASKEKDLNLKQTNSSYTLPQEKQQQPATQPAAHAVPKSQPAPPPPPAPKQLLGKQRGAASLKENETKKRAAVEEENVTFCQSTSYVPIVATSASTDELTVSTTTTYVPIIEETDHKTTTHSRQTTSIYKSTAKKKTNQIKTDVSDSTKNLENGYSNSQDGAIGTVPVVYEPMSPISVQFVKIGKKMICLESPQSAMSPPLPIQSVFFTIPDQQPASNNNTIKFYKSHPKPASIPTFGARRLDGAILVSHHQLRSKRDDILKAVLNKSAKNTPHRPNILKDDKSDGKLNFKRTVPDEFHSNDNCKQTRLTPDVNGFILHADMSESADAPQTNNCIQKKIAPLNIK